MEKILKKIEFVLTESFRTLERQKDNKPSFILPLHAGYLEASIESLIEDLVSEKEKRQDEKIKLFIEDILEQLENLLVYANKAGEYYSKEYPTEKNMFKAGVLESGLIQIIITINRELNNENHCSFVKERIKRLEK
jgi:hypothetical protein